MIAKLIVPVIVAVLFVCGSCIEDSVSGSPADQPEFSVDTLRLGTVFTGEPTPTYKFTVYNRHDKIITLSSVSVRDNADNAYRLNVDGMSGQEIVMTDIRPNDSVMVFVEVAFPDSDVPGAVRKTAYIDFVTSGVTRSVAVVCDAVNVKRMRSLTVDADMELDPAYPYIIYDSLVVDEGATLRLQPGVRLMFHDKARMNVRGNLIAEGTPDSPVEMCGDRLGYLVSSIPYDVMSGQWQGIELSAGSSAIMSHTVIKNSVDGVYIGPGSNLDMTGCVLRNAVNYPLKAEHASVSATGCEIAEGGKGVISVAGGALRLDHCTVANYYLFSAIAGPLIQLGHTGERDDDGSGKAYLSASIGNCVLFGMTSELNIVDLTGTDIIMRRCLLKSNGSDDANFIDCLWGTDPEYHVDRAAYVFDYHIAADSPAVDAAFLDNDGRVVSPLGEDVTHHIGAYPPR